MDPRLRAAVDASVCWYDDIMAAHRVPTARRGPVWQALTTPPRWHSAVKTLEPGVPVSDVLAAMAAHPHGSVADSFGDLPLDRHGFTLLIDATWLHLPAVESTGTRPERWVEVEEVPLLDAWNAAHDTTGVLLPALLTHPRFRFLARVQDGRPVAGAVTHDAGAVVGLSNTWTSDGHARDLPGVVATVGMLNPGRAVTDYAWGEELEEALAVGFTPVGPQRVWLR